MATERNQTALHLFCLSSPRLTSRSPQEAKQRDECINVPPHAENLLGSVFLQVSIEKEAIKKSINLCQLMSRFTHLLVVLRGPSLSDLAFVPGEAASALWGI